ncbi:YjbG polysaccharide synthesis-related protein [Vibrio campbellii]|uniref:capsule biosynthesis GfcC family protein n=1 Tax=Vibrio campbellii TaxID=680 RepID=UPI0009BF124D|nr:capsule biosynthesis GfcC family protein [Vibrio campbellii]AUW03274.1 YjbG polysaccharide synthesis-related protein [Vibrio campbellii]OQQ00389.1 YjbG polysaccharide synthesis-related protein [Vibrio campbellii]
MSKRLLSLLSLVSAVGITALPVIAQNQSLPPLQVELVGTGKALQFEQPARLEQVLRLAQEQQVILQYPLATALFDSSDSAKQETTALKNSVLNQMIQHNLIAHPLYKFIQKSQFAPRVLSNLDIDKVRLDKLENPLLNGQVSLSAPPREEKVLYLGNIGKIFTVRNQAGISLYEQLHNLQQSEIGDLSQPPILIYPDGSVAQPQFGNWFTKKYYLPPLTLVYVPFEEFDHSKIDQDIVKLLTQRKLTSTKN